MTEEEKAAEAAKAPKASEPTAHRADQRAADYAAHGDAAPWIPKSRLDEEAGKRRAAEERIVKEYAPVAEKASKLEAELTNARHAHAFDLAAVRSGLADDDDVAEFRDRYSRIQPGEDGKKPSPSAWFADLQAKAKEGKLPKWAVAYFPAPKATEVEDDEEVAPPRKTAAKSRAEEPDPNVGGKAADPGGSRVWTAERLDRVAPDVVRTHHPAVMADLEKAGLVIAPTKWLARRKQA